MKIIPLFTPLVVGLLAAGCNQNNQPTAGNDTNQPGVYPNNPSTGLSNVDNSRINMRDQGASNLTSLDQGNSDADIKTSASIRKMMLSATNDFSLDARNIKIITQNGKVTLRGPVNSDTEKSQIGAIAKGVAGDGNVENDLDVKTNP